MSDISFKAERSLITTYRKGVYSKFIKAIKDFNLIKAGDKIAVCISGGKDSIVLAKCMQELKKHGVDNFDVEYIVMNPGYSEKNLNKIKENLFNLEIPATITDSDVFLASERASGGDSPCYLCARMRRGWLYAKAKELGCNKIALGHHFDDVIETILMGVLYNGQVQSMLPRIKSENFAGMELIRPLYYVRERDIICWKKYNELSFLQCACKMTENLNEEGGTGTSKRQEVKELIRALEEKDRNIPFNIYKSVYNVQLGGVIEYKDKNGVRHNFLEDFN